MTDVDTETEAKRIEAERQRLEGEIHRIGFHLGMPDAASIARHNARVAELQRELAALPPRAKLPATRPQRVIIDGRLGSDFGRPAPESTHRAACDYNPWARHYGND